MKPTFRGLLILAILFGSSIAQAATCQKTGETCIDTTPSKVISGVTVTLAQAGGCWEYQDTYNCLQPNAVNYCQPLINAAPACWQTGSVCSQMDTTFGTGCMQYTQTYECGSSTMSSAPANTIQLADTYTLVSSNYDTSACASIASSNCSIASSSCTSTTPATPLPPGINSSAAAPDGCYQQTNTYACLDGTSTSDCGQYSSNPNCSAQTSTCENTLPNGTCAVNQQTYSCMTTPASTTTTNNCSGQTFCQGGNCFNTGHPNDTAFATATALTEAGREGGVYNQNGVIFTGVPESCRIRLFGLANCCKTNGGGSGYSNNAVMGVAMQVGGEAFSAGSRYAYDALYNDAPDFMQSGMSALTGYAGNALSGFSPSVGLYGLSVSYTGFAVGGVAGGVATTAVSGAASAAAGGAAGAAASSGLFSSLAASYNAATITSSSFGGFVFAFNPYALAFTVAIMVVEDLTKCDTQEQMLGLKRGQNLCTYVGTYCSESINLLVGSICMENTQSYCCYNSLLAKLINEQGRAQIGKAYGSAQSPDCSGFTTAQFAQIDFSKIDLSQFTAQITASVVPPIVGGITQNAHGVVQQKIQNYYLNGSQ
ncbi:MAG: conjugal transfer protein TraN [Sulfuriferula sp.]